jgi:predicted nucleic acid-binding protein
VGAVIDSSVLVAAERGQLELGALAKLLAPGEQVAISAVTASELLHGVHRAKKAAQRGKREAFVERILNALPVLPFDLLAARIHARIWAELAGKGQNVGAHDLIIAATALAAGFSVATRDERSFPKVSGLQIIRV